MPPRQPAGVAADCLQAGFAPGEGEDLLVDGQLQLPGKRGDVRRGGAEQAALNA
ncbi:MAG TPA: hypothetical protein VF655_13235 [Allosphingosinicella sp.]